MTPHDEPQPPKRDVNWWLLIFSLFIAFVFFDPLQRQASRLEWVLTSLGVAAFLGLFVVVLVFHHRKPVALGAIAGMALLGFVFAPFNLGAAVFVIYATAVTPYAAAGDIRLTVTTIISILALVVAESWLLNLGWVFAAYSVAYGIVNGAGNLYAARQALTVERLAKVAERERIARDLHDVLGHTLSVIILKAELAGKLLDRDRERAKVEIGDVERISRAALAEVRQTIRGYRTESLQAELERARSTLETAGVAVECHSSPVGITPAQEGVLALALREAVTNVVRHAHASTCRLRLQEVDGTCQLEIQDDGRGGAHAEGYGMRGMRERIEAFGGTLLHDAGAGTRLTITLPLTATGTTAS